MDFARRLKALIKEGDKLQKEIAKDLNIPETTFSGYVRGKSRPDIETLVKIAEYFNVNTDYLYGMPKTGTGLFAVAKAKGFCPNIIGKIFIFRR